MPLVINSLGGGHTHTNTQTHIQTDIRIGTISRNQACTGLRPAHAWFKNDCPLKYFMVKGRIVMLGRITRDSMELRFMKKILNNIKLLILYISK